MRRRGALFKGVFGALCLGALLSAPLPGRAAPCRLALLLAMDVSASVDAREFMVQRQGLAEALAVPEIREAILSGGGPVALGVYEWSGRYQQKVILPWTMLTDEAAIDGAASAVMQVPRSTSGFPTAAGYALGYGARMMGGAPRCDRKVIDMSGDGVNNEGFSPALAYANFPLRDVTVNGLAILGPDAGVLEFYRSEIAHGPGAFVETANGYGDFRRAIRRKLFREVKIIAVGGLPAAGETVAAAQ